MAMSTAVTFRGGKVAAAVALSLLFVIAADAEKNSLVGGTVINPGDGKIIENAVLVINGDTIESVASRKEAGVPVGSRWVDCKGKFILPGYIDTHVHFFQSGDLYARPDVVDLNSVRPYKDEIAWVKAHLDDVFARYLRCGITSVVDVGGPMWNFEVRRRANSTAKAPRVAVAGPLISSVARPQLDLGDPPVVKIHTPEQGREFVRKLAAQNPDYIKIWYIVPPPAEAGHPERSRGTPSPTASAPSSPQTAVALTTSSLESDAARAAIFRPVVHAVIEESNARKLRVAVHATELEAARASIEEGADLLVHSVTDKLVDEAFVRLLKERGTILTPTLVVFERYGRAFANKLNLTPEEKAWGNPEVIASLDVTKLPSDKVPDRIKTALAAPDAALDRIRQTYDIALKNLKTLEDAGITIAAGTDAGNIGTIHGPALFREFQLMKEAGLTPMQILQSATDNAAKVFDGGMSSVSSRKSDATAGIPPSPKMGAIAPGKLADLVILNSNPLDDIAHASDIGTIIKGGTLLEPESIVPH